MGSEGREYEGRQNKRKGEGRGEGLKEEKRVTVFEARGEKKRRNRRQRDARMKMIMCV